MFDTKAQENLAIAIGLVFIAFFFFSSGLISFNNNTLSFGLNAIDEAEREAVPELGVERELFDGRVYVTDTVFGTGAVVEPGTIITMHYVGGLLSGEIFDNSYDRDEPIQFISGVGMVIPGIDGGIQGMQIGGKRTIVIAPEFGYGEEGIGPIPGGATLVFQVEIVNVEKREVGVVDDSESIQ